MNQVQVFNFNDRQVRTIMQDESPWWVLKDVCEVLNLRAPDVKQRLHDDVVSTHAIPDSIGRVQKSTIINEDGLYDVILESRKPEARAFRKWITHDVLPTIRKTGMYINDNQKAFSVVAEIDKAAKLINFLQDNKSIVNDATCKALKSQIIELMGGAQLPNVKPPGLGTAAIASFIGVTTAKIAHIVRKHQLKKPEYGDFYTYEFRGAPKEIFLFNEAGKSRIVELLGAAVHA